MTPLIQYGLVGVWYKLSSDAGSFFRPQVGPEDHIPFGSNYWEPGNNLLMEMEMYDRVLGRYLNDTNIG
jgi:hypothetical protein